MGKTATKDVKSNGCLSRISQEMFADRHNRQLIGLSGRL